MSQRRIALGALFAVLLITLVSIPASAATVFSNSSGASSTPAFTVDGILITGRAVGFTVPAGASYRLNSATLSLARTINISASATVRVHSNNSGVPGSSLATLGTVNPSSTTLTNYTVTSSGGVQLSGGTTYWLVVTGSNLSMRRTTAAFSGDFTAAGSKSNSVLGWQNSLLPGSFVVSLDADAPVSVTSIARASSSPTNAASVTWNVTFSGTLSGLSQTNFALAASGVSGAAITNVSGSGSSWTVTASTGSGDGTLGLNLVSSTGLLPGVSSSLPYVGETYSLDRTGPTTQITTTATEPTNVSPIPVTVTFSENVTGFVAGGVTVSNGAVQNFAGGPAVYTFDVVPTGSGLVTVDVAGSVATDAAGNGNSAAQQLAMTYDNAGPTVTISSSATNPTSVSPIPITIQFSEEVSGFNPVTGVVIGNGTASNFAGTTSTVTFDLTPTGPGIVTVDVPANVAQDSAGNSNSAAQQFSISFDSDVPTVTISSAAPDPTNVSPIPVTVQFSESVNGFNPVSGIVIGNGTASNFAGTTSTVTFDLTPASPGLVTVDVPANVAQDDAGNWNTAAPQFTITFAGEGLRTLRLTLMNDGTDAHVTIPNPVPSATPAFSLGSGVNPAVHIDATTGELVYEFEPGAPPAVYTVTVHIVSGGQAFDQQVAITLVAAPPPVPLCEAHNFDGGGVVRTGGMSDAIVPLINCRVLYQNGGSTTWLGSDMYSEANLGVPGLMELGIQQAIDIFSPGGLTYFEGGAVFCLRGSGTLIWMAASQAPRQPAIIGSYTVPDFAGFTCATLFEPGTLVLVSDNPMD